MHLTLPTGDRLEQSSNAAIVYFSGKRKVLSTGALGGGLRTDLKAVFNHNDCPRAGAYCEMQGETLEQHQQHTAGALGLDPQTTTGLNTGANIDNAAIITTTHDDFAVTAIATAGVEVNGCRVGNPANLHENDGKTRIITGTINIILVVDAKLTDGCMARALVTCTEAKVAALQELVVSDRYSNSLATGSGTDGTIVICNSDSPVTLSQAGEHYKLGEVIGKTVINAVKEALYRQSGLCPGMQHSVIRRLDRFGITEQSLWESYSRACSQPVSYPAFSHMVSQMSLDGTTVTYASLYAHLMDQLLWGLLLPQEATEAGDRILGLVNQHYGVTEEARTPWCDDTMQAADAMTSAFTHTITRLVMLSQNDS